MLQCEQFEPDEVAEKTGKIGRGQLEIQPDIPNQIEITQNQKGTFFLYTFVNGLHHWF